MNDDVVDDPDGVLDEGDLLLEVVRSIVRNPQKVEVVAERGPTTTTLTITVDPEDRGHVIGRERRTMDALIHLFSKSATIEGRRTIIRLAGADLRPKPERRPQQRPRQGRSKQPQPRHE
jgi:predicted RNA-binding protein YlqC (UPF0109 family)